MSFPSSVSGSFKRVCATFEPLLAISFVFGLQPYFLCTFRTQLLCGGRISEIIPRHGDNFQIGKNNVERKKVSQNFMRWQFQSRATDGFRIDTIYWHCRINFFGSFIKAKNEITADLNSSFYYRTIVWNSRVVNATW